MNCRVGWVAMVMIMMACMLLATGCWSRKELNELAIVTAIGLDRHKSGYAVTVQVMNSSESGAQNNSESLSAVTYQAVGETIPDALHRILREAPRQLYLSHIRILVFGEDLARAGLSGQLDFFSRNHEIRSDFYLLVARQAQAADVLRVLTPFEQIPANSLFTSIMVANRKWAAAGRVTLQKFVTELERRGADPVLSGVRIVGSVEKGRSRRNLGTIDPDTTLRHIGLAVFKDDKLVGWLDEGRSKTVNYITNEVQSTLAFVDCPGAKNQAVSIDIMEAKSKTTVKLDAEGRPHFTVRLKLEANIGSVQCAVNLSKPEEFEQIERSLEAKANQAVTDNIKYIQQTFGADVFGFGETLHRQLPKVWRSYRNRWSELYKTAEVEVHTKANIRRIGSIVQPVKREMKQQ